MSNQARLREQRWTCIVLTVLLFGLGAYLILPNASGKTISTPDEPTEREFTADVPPVPNEKSRETAWTQYLALLTQSKAEVRTPDGSRIDLVDPAGGAWEVEWATKWKESIGQAGWYAVATDRHPGVILLVGKNRLSIERKHIQRCMAVCEKFDIHFRTANVKNFVLDDLRLPHSKTNPPAK